MTEPERQSSAALDRATARDVSPRDRIAALGELAKGLGRKVASPSGVLEAVLEIGPRLSVRDLATLRDHHHGATGRELAEELVSNAARVTAAIGAAAGAVASASELATPALLTAPVQLGVETLATVAVELKLVAELHAALGIQLPEDLQHRATLVLRAWATGRGIKVSDLAGGAGVSSVLGRAARAQVRDRVLKKFARSTVGFLPLLAGAAAGAAANSRGTKKLGAGIIDDLAHPRRGWRGRR